MRESESFDAFYARTARNVTSQMQSFTHDAEQTDSAVREAYARAFQQWFEVSGYRDAEAWVLDAAKDIYRRHAGAAGGRPAGDTPLGGGAASGTPYGGPAGGTAYSYGAPFAGGPADTPFQSAPADAPFQSAPAGGPFPGGPAGGSFAGGQAASPAAGGIPESDSTLLPGVDRRGADYAGNALPGGASANPTSILGTPTYPMFGQAPAGQTDLGQAGGPYLGGPELPGQRIARGGRRPSPGRPGTRGLIAIALAVIVVAAVGAYLALGGHGHKNQTAGSRSKAKVTAKPKPHMLAAGKVAGHSSIPWTLVGQGWTLAELSSAQPNADGGSAGGGTSDLYLVDPKGGRYFITQWSSVPQPTLLAWSGNGQTALLETTSSSAGAPSFSYSLLTVATGQVTGLPLPANVTAVGFTRPDGLAILAVRQGGGKLKLQRYTFSGSLQASIASLPHNPSDPGFEPGSCGPSCGALSSPDGDTDVWGTRWNAMQLVSNTGGTPRRFHLTAGKKSADCAPVSWWNATTVLADCAASQPSPDSDQLWLVPADGGTPTALAAASGGPDGVGFDLTATAADGTAYLTQTSSTQCPSAASGPGGLTIEQVGTGGALSGVGIPGTTNTRNTVLAAEGSRLLVLAQTSCPGSYSLLWFYPSKGTQQVLLPASAGQLGVTAAVPFSNL